MRKFVKMAFVAVFVTAAGYGVYTSQKSEVMSDLALANVEALAQSEGGSSDCDTYCESDVRYTCYISWGSGIEGVTCPEHCKKRN